MGIYDWAETQTLRLLNSGSQHFNSLVDLKQNRVLNLLISLNFIAFVMLNFFETYTSIILLSRDFSRYMSYILPFTILNIVHFAVAFGVMQVKNRYGSFSATYFSTGIAGIVCATLAAFIGPAVGPHIILFSLIPIFFFMYPYAYWKPVLIHLGVLFSGIAACFAGYAWVQPLYPLPEDLATQANFFCWGLAVVFMLLYSFHNWREVGKTEKLLQEEKNQTLGLLNETIPKLTVAEAKFRHLVNDSPDLIFQLDENAVFLSMNMASKAMLRFAPDEMIGKSFYEFVADDNGADPQAKRNIARGHFQEFSTGTAVKTFRTLLRTKYPSDGVEVQIALKKNPTGETFETIAKASHVEINVAQKFLRKERGSYEISNDLLQAESLLQHISEKLVRFFPAKTAKSLNVGMREIVINAIEHGNLGISFDEKSKLLEQGDYLEFLRTRSRLEQHAHQLVYIDFLLNPKIFLFRVRDCGAGFDHQAMTKRTMAGSEEIQDLGHGRGANMTRKAFDSVTYNDKGNEVILLKRVP